MMAFWSTSVTFGSSQQPHRCSGCDSTAMKGKTRMLPVRQLPQPALLTDELFSKKPWHIPAKYSGWHWLFTFLQLSRTTLNIPRIPVISVSTRSPNLTDHHHMLLISTLPSTPLIWLNLLYFPVISYFSTALWNSWFAISILSCVSHSSLNICFPFFL